MLLYIANCGRDLIALHENDREGYVNDITVSVPTKRSDTMISEPSTLHIEESTKKMDLIILQLNNITDALNLLQLSSVDRQGSSYNSPARKMPASNRNATVMDMTTPAEGQDMTEY